VRSLVKLLVNLVSLALIIPFAHTFWAEVIGFDTGVNRNWMFLIGTGVSAIVCYVLARRLEFFATFEHELTHNVWALLFFKKPMGFHVNEDGSGLFQFQGRTSTISELFISLAPYFFPTVTVLLIMVSPIIREDFMGIYYLFIGITYGYHISSTIKETHLQQTDITGNGYFTSLNLIISLNLLANGLVLAFISGGWSGMGDFFTDSFTFATEAVKHLY